VSVVVVGAGINGLAAARALARRGRRTLVLERFQLGHARGSSHGRSRIFRLADPDAVDVRDAREAQALWRELEREAGERLLVTTGSLDSGAYADRTEQALTACGVACERLGEEEVSARFAMTVRGSALFQPDGGILLADRCAAALAAGALAAGAEIRERTVVTEIRTDGDAVHLETSGGPVEAGAVVVAARAGAPALLRRAGVALDAVPTRETVVYARPVRERQVLPLAAEVEPGRIAYALEAPGVGIKGALHQAGPIADPDEEGTPSAEAAAEAAEWIRSVYGDGETAAVETCLYTNRTDDRFALERHGRVVVGSACSGHGFKFAPATGARLASLTEEAFA
jgi:sarcosine oxidase